MSERELKAFEKKLKDLIREVLNKTSSQHYSHIKKQIEKGRLEKMVDYLYERCLEYPLYEGEEVPLNSFVLEMDSDMAHGHAFEGTFIDYLVNNGS